MLQLYRLEIEQILYLLYTFAKLYIFPKNDKQKFRSVLILVCCCKFKHKMYTEFESRNSN